MSAAKSGVTVIEETEKRQSFARFYPGKSYSSESSDSVHVLLMRIVGSFTLAFGVVEIGLGFGIFTFLDHVKLGAWWVGFITVVAGLCAIAALNKGWVTATCVVASAACITAVVGAALDGIGSLTFQDLTACSSASKPNSQIYNYGSAADYQYSNACLAATSPLVPGVCYCIKSGGSACSALSLAGSALYFHQDCGNILTTYANSLTASTAFCVLCFANVFTLFILSCVMLCCANTSSFLTTRALEGPIGSASDLGISGNAGKSFTF